MSFPFGKGKTLALKLLEIDIPGLDQVLGQPGAIHAQLVSTAPVASQAPLDIVGCRCTAECKACSGTRYSSNSAGLSCTDYCKYEGGDICCSPFISKQMDIEDDEGETSVDDK